MAIENVSVNGNLIATDEVGGLMFQIVKLAHGADGAMVMVSDSNPLPVSGGLTFSGAIPAGTNNIGDVDVASLPGALSGITPGAAYSTQPGLPSMGVRQDTAAALADDGELAPLTVDNLGRLRVASLVSLRTTDAVSAALAVDKLMNDRTELTPKFARANVASGTTDGSIVAAVASKKIRVLAFRINLAGTATNVTFNSKPAGAGTAISEVFQLDARGGFSGGFSPVGHFETASGEGLSVTTAAGSQVGIGVVYVEV